MATWKSDKSFETILDETVRLGEYRGYPLWSIRKRVAVDEFIRQETLKADLEKVLEKLGIPMPEQLPQMKSKMRKDRRPAREILSDAQKEIVYRFCKREFRILGYKP